jgi:hypothetical protein
VFPKFFGNDDMVKSLAVEIEGLKKTDYEGGSQLEIKR